MTATWYLVKHVPDLRRREPHNVGLVLQTPEGWMTRFLAEAEDGSIDGRRLPHSLMSTDAYKTWVSYFRRKAGRDQWQDVTRMQGRRVGNYFAEMGGHILQPEGNWSATLDRLYTELVEPAGPAKKKQHPVDALLSTVDRVLDAAHILPQRQIEVDAKFSPDGPITKVPFRFSFVNGDVHLMDLVHERTRPDHAAADARELRARMDAACRAGSARNFVTFYDSSLLAEVNLDDILFPIEKVAEAIDVDNFEQATEAVRHIASH